METVGERGSLGRSLCLHAASIQNHFTVSTLCLPPSPDPTLNSFLPYICAKIGNLHQADIPRRMIRWYLRREIQQPQLCCFSSIPISYLNLIKAVAFTMADFMYRSTQTTENKRMDIIDFSVDICRKSTMWDWSWSCECWFPQQGMYCLSDHSPTGRHTEIEKNRQQKKKTTSLRKPCWCA